MALDAAHDYEFRCEPSRVAAFVANFNSRLHFRNFPIAKGNRIPADGVEVLFYCLRMGRCMLAAMAAGYQRMLARDASHYAKQRSGVGGPVIRHEVPRLNLGRILGGALLARSLAYLSLQQDADGVDLAGLRDLTKSAAAGAGIESMLAAEHVLGGRAFHGGSRVNDARVNLHLFGVVEGEDDLILMGMVRDVTQRFVDRYLSALLGVIDSREHAAATARSVPADQRILRIGLATLLRYPGRSLAAKLRLLVQPKFWLLGAWVARNAVVGSRALAAAAAARRGVRPLSSSADAAAPLRTLRRAQAPHAALELSRLELVLPARAHARANPAAALRQVHRASRLDARRLPSRRARRRDDAASRRARSPAAARQIPRDPPLLRPPIHAAHAPSRRRSRRQPRSRPLLPDRRHRPAALRPPLAAEDDAQNKR